MTLELLSVLKGVLSYLLQPSVLSAIVSANLVLGSLEIFEVEGISTQCCVDFHLKHQNGTSSFNLSWSHYL